MSVPTFSRVRYFLTLRTPDVWLSTKDQG